ncbi:unnamed protein product, partial [marine sediment metagenome]
LSLSPLSFIESAFINPSNSPDTLYGLAALLSDEKAVKEVYKIKKRDIKNPIPILKNMSINEDIKANENIKVGINTKARKNINLNKNIRKNNYLTSSNEKKLLDLKVMVQINYLLIILFYLKDLD